MDEHTTDQTAEQKHRALRAGPMPLAERKRLLNETKPDLPKDQVFSDWASI
jgi:hypothetical protein